MSLETLCRRSIRRSLCGLGAVGFVSALGCTRPVEPPPAVSLVEGFSSAVVTGSPDVRLEFPRLEWRDR